MINKLERQINHIEEIFNLLENVPYNDLLYTIMKNDLFKMIHDYEGGDKFEDYMNRYLKLKKVNSNDKWKEDCRGI